MPKEEIEDTDTEQITVRVPRWLLKRSKEAAAWDGLKYAEFLRSAILHKTRKIEHDRAREERAMTEDPGPP